MFIVSIRHKGLKKLIVKNDSSGLPQQYVGKIRGLLQALDVAETIEHFLALPKGRPHKLKGDRAGTYAITIYANWRITFKYDVRDHSIHILDFEDYH